MELPNFIYHHLLSWMIFLPVIGMLVISVLPNAKKEAMKWVASGFTLLPLLLGIALFLNFDRQEAGLQFMEQYSWIPTFNIHYFVGADGLSVTMILLTALLSFLCIFASWNIKEGLKGYLCMFLLLEAGMMGVFCALDFFLFYVFWEVMLLPMYFLIGIWGGPKKEYAAIKFFLYTLFGSVLMLVAMLAFYFYSEPHTFSLVELSKPGTLVVKDLTLFGIALSAAAFKKMLFIFLFIGFAIKVPIFPFHTWLPLAHVEAPTPISVILAGVLLKMGTYGLLRISFPILPQETYWFSYALAIFGLINIVYGALCAMAQITLSEKKGGNDLKKLIAYSSISHMGYVILGMSVFTIEGINGAVFQMFNHGITTAMLFLLVGVIYDRVHHRKIDGFGGLGVQVPIYTGIVSLAFFASLGLPGLSSFISEALVFLGAFKVYPSITVLATLGIILNAAFFLWALQKIFLGPLNQKYINLKDVSARELFTLVPLGILVVFLGIYPMPVLDLMKQTLDQILILIQAA
ncbi:MAG: oxidoreductase [Deltaproteobacteria bacterium RIFCSPHIGHO2_02_FULL_40_11]|nr:MAG: oxidoreductase [Deltaproteobacteria bacterium RIFCSPHIGHO2_02_FULL_40_11]